MTTIEQLQPDGEFKEMTDEEFQSLIYKAVSHITPLPPAYQFRMPDGKVLWAPCVESDPEGICQQDRIVDYSEVWDEEDVALFWEHFPEKRDTASLD